MPVRGKGFSSDMLKSSLPRPLDAQRLKCARCGEVKPREAFYTRWRAKFVDSWCKQCRKIYNQQKRKAGTV